MIVLDTNVLSERLRPRPNAAVMDWLRAVADDAAITSITAGELVYGVERLPAGRRRDVLAGAVERTLTAAADRLLPYDEPAARLYGVMRASREAAGRPLSVEDGMIAAVCRARAVPLATRNVDDFVGLGVELVNPWVDT